MSSLNTGSAGVMGSAVSRYAVLRRALLVCGILSSLILAGADILAGLRYEGYSFVYQYVSELSAIGSPSRPLLVAAGFAYAFLTMAFGLGVRESAGSNRTLRTVSTLLLGYGIICLVGPFTPMHARGAQKTLTDTLHVVGAVLDVLFILAIVAAGARAFGRRFRVYSIGTLLVFLVVAAWSFLAAPQLGKNLPTPWVGVTERISIYGFLLWVAVLAIVLLRAQLAKEL